MDEPVDAKKGRVQEIRRGAAKIPKGPSPVASRTRRRTARKETPQRPKPYPKSKPKSDESESETEVGRNLE